jgi:CheY-like chemotaxis protein
MEASMIRKAENLPYKGRILVVGDEAALRWAIERLLREYETVVAANGAAAMRILKRDQSFDLIICDVMMPEVSGIDLHRWLVKEHEHLASPFIFITGDAFIPADLDYLAQVDNPCLIKPFDLWTFMQLVSAFSQRTKHCARRRRSKPGRSVNTQQRCQSDTLKYPPDDSPGLA